MASQLPAKRLAVIKAPAGFDKTSLAASWSEWLRRRGSSIAWLAIDSDDNEPPRFSSLRGAGDTALIGS
jgi:LuxR family maltose regulon positive regulatory protein